VIIKKIGLVLGIYMELALDLVVVKVLKRLVEIE
jgi:hypothetical protein